MFAHVHMQRGLQQITDFHAITTSSVTVHNYIEHINSSATGELQTPGMSEPHRITLKLWGSVREASVICITLMSLTSFLDVVALPRRTLEAVITCNFSSFVGWTPEYTDRGEGCLFVSKQAIRFSSLPQRLSSFLS